jgi:hypothetical protein
LIPVGTELQPRHQDDCAVTVVGIAEPSRYVLQPTEFGANFAMTYDEITAAFVTDGHEVFIEPYDEQKSWAKLSRERYHGKIRDQLRSAKKAAAEESPEEYFSRVEAEAADG